jgi:hypothetical protein
VAVEAEQPGGGEGGAGAGGGGRISGDERERAATGEARPRERFGERTYSPTEAQAQSKSHRRSLGREGLGRNDKCGPATFDDEIAFSWMPYPRA